MTRWGIVCFVLAIVLAPVPLDAQQPANPQDPAQYGDNVQGDGAPTGSLDAEDITNNYQDYIAEPTALLKPTSPQNNVAVKHLSALFGQNWGYMLFGKQAGNTNSSVLQDMVAVFNVITLAAMIIMVISTFITGAMDTAHTGETFGQYSTMWAPIRMVAGFTAMAPLPWAKGFTLLQAMILFLTYLGIGGADTIWQITLNEIRDRGGRITGQPMGAIEMETTSRILIGLTVQEAMKKFDGKIPQLDNVDSVNIKEKPFVSASIEGGGGSSNDGYYPIVFTVNSDVESHNWVYDVSKDDVTLNSRDDDALGVLPMIEVPCSMDVNSDLTTPIGGEGPEGTTESTVTRICESRKAYTKQLAADLRPHAQQIVLEAAGHSGKADRIQPEHSILGAMKEYNENMNELGEKHIQSGNLMPALDQELKQFVTIASAKGWASAGQWYWTLSDFHQQAAKMAKLTPKVSGLNTGKISDKMGGFFDRPMRTLQKRVERANVTLEQQENAANPIGASGTWSEYLISYWNEGVKNTVGRINMEQQLTEGDPIANLQSYGNTIITLGYYFYGATVVARASVEGGEKVTDSAVGSVADLATGGALGALATGASVIVSDAIFFGRFLIFPLFILGITLAYYIPSIPWIVWTLTYVGWIMLVIEAIVAAPLWAGAIIMPHGQGFIGRHGNQGFMLLLNMIMRPALMVVGFFTSIIIYHEIAAWVGRSFSVFRSGLEAGQMSGPIAFIVTTAILGGMMIVLAHKLFGLIHHLPDHTLRWIGQNVQPFGEQQEEQQVNAMAGGVYGRVESAGDRAVSGGGDKPEPGDGGDEGEDDQADDNSRDKGTSTV